MAFPLHKLDPAGDAQIDAFLLKNDTCFTQNGAKLEQFGASHGDCVYFRDKSSTRFPVSGSTYHPSTGSVDRVAPPKK